MNWGKSNLADAIGVYQTMNFLREVKRKKIPGMRQRLSDMNEALDDVIVWPAGYERGMESYVEIEINRPMRKQGFSSDEIAEETRKFFGVPTKAESEEMFTPLIESVDFLEKNDKYIESRYQKSYDDLKSISERLSNPDETELIHEVEDLLEGEGELPRLLSEDEIRYFSSSYESNFWDDAEEENFFNEGEDGMIPYEDRMRNTGHFQIEGRSTGERRASDPIDDDEVELIGKAMKEYGRNAGIFDTLGLHETRRKKVNDFILEQIGFTEKGESMGLAEMGVVLKEKYDSNHEHISTVGVDLMDKREPGDDFHVSNFMQAMMLDPDFGEPVDITPQAAMRNSSPGRKKFKYNPSQIKSLGESSDHIKLFRSYLKLRNRLVNVGIDGLKSPSKSRISKESDKLATAFVNRFVDLSRLIPLKYHRNKREVFASNTPEEGFNVRVNEDGSNTRKNSEKMEGVYLYLKELQVNDMLSDLGLSYDQIEEIEKAFIK